MVHCDYVYSRLCVQDLCDVFLVCFFCDIFDAVARQGWLGQITNVKLLLVVDNIKIKKTIFGCEISCIVLATDMFL
jgi:hypothetical protein